MTLYDRVASTEAGSRVLAQARLRRETLRCLCQAKAASGLSVEEIASRIGGRRREVRRDFNGDGNIHVAVLARYLHAMGFEAELRIVPAGEPRRKAVEGHSGWEQLADTSGFTTTDGLIAAEYQRRDAAADAEFQRRMLDGDGEDREPRPESATGPVPGSSC